LNWSDLGQKLISPPFKRRSAKEMDISKSPEEFAAMNPVKSHDTAAPSSDSAFRVPSSEDISRHVSKVVADHVPLDACLEPGKTDGNAASACNLYESQQSLQGIGPLKETSKHMSQDSDTLLPVNDSHSNDTWKGPLTRARKRKFDNLASSVSAGNDNNNVYNCKDNKTGKRKKYK
jgi:hypothetical protein